jgi:hypothetical protein
MRFRNIATATFLCAVVAASARGQTLRVRITSARAGTEAHFTAALSGDAKSAKQFAGVTPYELTIPLGASMAAFTSASGSPDLRLDVLVPKPQYSAWGNRVRAIRTRGGIRVEAGQPLSASR